MIYAQTDIFGILAGIIGAILETLSPFVIPIGEWMVGTVEFFLQYFPYGNYSWDDLIPYVVIFVILIIIGIIVNSIWPGDKAEFGKTKEVRIEQSVEKCKECNMPCKPEKVCAYCGFKN